MAKQQQKIVTVASKFISFAEEKPAENKYPVRDSDNKRLEGCDLFSLFTANIIKENVTFTR